MGSGVSLDVVVKTKISAPNVTKYRLKYASLLIYEKIINMEYNVNSFLLLHSSLVRTHTDTVTSLAGGIHDISTKPVWKIKEILLRNENDFSLVTS
jgi:hypothetical protein